MIPKDDPFFKLVDAYNRGQQREVIKLAKEYVKTYPRDHRAYHIAAQSSLELEETDVSIKLIKQGLKAVADSRASQAMLWDIYGRIEEANENMEDAETYHKRAALYNKREPLFPYHLGVFYRRAERYDEARPAYEEALARDPNHFASHNDIGLIAMEEKDYETAERSFNEVMKADVNHHQAWQNLSHIMLEYPENPRKALDYARKAIELLPTSCEYQMTLARYHGVLGDKKDAAREYKKALDLPKNEDKIGNIWLGITRYRPEKEHIATLKKLIKDEEDARYRGEFKFALARVYEKQEDYKNAEDYFLSANEEIDSVTDEGYVEFLREWVENMKTSFNEIDIAGKPEDAEKIGNSVVCILGTMRCGSSLMEQILACHSQIGAAGEVTHLSQGMLKMGKYYDKPIHELHEMLPKDNREWFDFIGKQYMNRIGYFYRHQNPKLMTDKQLDNFLLIGWIRLILPGAKIIRSMRRPQDSALSIFCNYFAAKAHTYAYNMQELSNFFYLYEDMMVYWKKTCGSAIFESQYEEFVSDHEPRIKAIMDFIGMEKEPAMDEFFKSSRPVQTASSTQVRSGLYQDSINKIDRYPTIKQMWEEARKNKP